MNKYDMLYNRSTLTCVSFARRDLLQSVEGSGNREKAGDWGGWGVVDSFATSVRRGVARRGGDGQWMSPPASPMLCPCSAHATGRGSIYVAARRNKLQQELAAAGGLINLYNSIITKNTAQ